MAKSAFKTNPEVQPTFAFMHQPGTERQFMDAATCTTMQAVKLAAATREADKAIMMDLYFASMVDADALAAFNAFAPLQ